MKRSEMLKVIEDAFDIIIELGVREGEAEVRKSRSLIILEEIEKAGMLPPVGILIDCPDCPDMEGELCDLSEWFQDIEPAWEPEDD